MEKLFLTIVTKVVLPSQVMKMSDIKRETTNQIKVRWKLF